MKFSPVFASVLLALAGGCFAASATPAPLPVLRSVNEALPLLTGSALGEDSLRAFVAATGRDAKGRAAVAAELRDAAANSKLSFYVRSQCLQQLWIVAGPECVDALVALLSDSDPQICEYARMTLETVPCCPKASEALRDALKKGGATRWELGLIHSLGVRRDADSVALIAPFVAKPETSGVAIEALAQIATPKALAVVEKALPASAERLIQAAVSLNKGGKHEKAAALATQVFQAKVPAQVRASALAVLACASHETAVKLASAVVTDPSPALQATAVAIVGTSVPFKELNCAGKAAWLRIMDASCEATAIAALNDSDPAVCDAAAVALGRVGGAAAVPALLAAGAANPRDTAPPCAALAVIHGQGAEEAIRTAAADAAGTPKARALAITVLGSRGNPANNSDLVRFAADNDSAISRAACLALKSAGTAAELMPMLKLTLSGSVANASLAVRGIASRDPDRQKAIPEILALGSGAKGKALIPMLDALSIIGGPEALKAVVGYTGSTDPDVVDAAVHALCKWPELDGADALLKIGADQHFPESLRLAALRAIEGIVVRAEDESPQARVDALLALLKTATRDDERSLALSAIAGIPNKAAMEALLPLLKDPQLKSLACQASLNLAEGGFMRKGGRRLAQAVVKAAPGTPFETRAKALMVRLEH